MFLPTLQQVISLRKFNNLFSVSWTSPRIIKIFPKFCILSFSDIITKRWRIVFPHFQAWVWSREDGGWKPWGTQIPVKEQSSLLTRDRHQEIFPTLAALCCCCRNPSLSSLSVLAHSFNIHESSHPSITFCYLIWTLHSFLFSLLNGRLYDTGERKHSSISAKFFLHENWEMTLGSPVFLTVYLIVHVDEGTSIW